MIAHCLTTVCGAFALLIALWLAHLIPVFFLGMPVYLVLKGRIKWTVIDTLCFVLPLVVWSLCMLFHQTDKSFSNASEVFALGIAETLVLFFRLTIGNRMSEKVVALAMLCILVLIAISLSAFIPFV